MKLDFTGAGAAQLSYLDAAGHQQFFGFPLTSYCIVETDAAHGPYGRVAAGFEGFGHTLWTGTTGGGTKTLNRLANLTPTSVSTRSIRLSHR